MTIMRRPTELCEDKLGARLRHVFSQHDGSSGAVSASALEEVLQQLDLPQAYAARLVRQIDVDGSGSVSFEEFHTFVRRRLKQLHAAFNAVDREQSGSIPIGSVHEMLEAMHLQLTAEDEDVLVSQLRAGSNHVTFESFLKVFALLQPIDLLTLYDNDAILLEFGSPTDFGGLLRRSSRGSLTRRESLALQKAKASPASNVLAARLFLGGVAATAQFVVHPVETVKVRLQNQGSSGERRYTGFAQGFRVVVADEGLLALYKGWWPAAAREMLYSSLRFGLYAPVKGLLGAEDPRDTPFWKKLFAGGFAGGLGSGIANPTDLVKIRQQADASVSNPKSVMAHARDIYRADGVLGFWKGASTTIVRAVVLGSTKLATYDEAKVQLKERLGLVGLAQQAGASCAAGFAYCVTTSPADVVRTRFMSAQQAAEQTGQPMKYSGPLDVARQTLAKEGPLAFYKGFLPQWARAMPYSMVQFLVWEQLAKLAGLTTV